MASSGYGLLAGKRILIMGVANKWSIAYAIGEAMKAAGATLILSYLDERMLKDCQAWSPINPRRNSIPAMWPTTRISPRWPNRSGPILGAWMDTSIRSASRRPMR